MTANTENQPLAAGEAAKNVESLLAHLCETARKDSGAAAAAVSYSPCSRHPHYRSWSVHLYADGELMHHGLVGHGMGTSFSRAFDDAKAELNTALASCLEPSPC